ncbi:MAG: DUF937 domain-containing protein [Pseudomonadota bacterium]
MNLTQLLVTQDNVDRLSAQFGLTEEQTLEAMAAVIPAFSEGLQRQASAPQSAASLVQALASGRHGGYAHDAALAVSDAGMADGRNILGHLFGNKDVSRGVASHAAASTGVSSSIIKAMLPALASMVMGALFKGSTGRGGGGLGSALGQAAGGGLLGTLIEGLAGGMLGQAKTSTRGRSRRTSRPRRRRSGGGMGLEDILGQVLGGGRAAQNRQVNGDPVMPRSRRTSSRRTQRRQSPSGGGLGDLLGELLGGNGTNNRRQRRANHQRTNQRGQEGIFGEMLQPGGRTTREDMRRTRSVFDEFLQG